MVVSACGTVLASTGSGGWKGRDPFLHYYALSEQSSDFLEGVTMDPGLSTPAHYIATCGLRKLILLADDERIKSFSFEPDQAGKMPKRPPNVHTMRSGRAFDGPIVMLPNGCIVRSGKGKMAIWNLDGLETHQDNPGKLIGEGRLSLADSSTGQRTVELSPGSVPHVTVPFADDPHSAPAVLHLHAPSRHLLCGEEAGAGRHACTAVDIEQGGRRVARFLGHGGAVERIATSAGDPWLFATAGGDGYARLFDVRRPLPVLTFDTGMQREACADIVLVHPDGIPSEYRLMPCFADALLTTRPPPVAALFTGGELTHQVKMWDIRAEECVYELSTGNNAVAGLAWDDARAALFVATECGYANRMGVRTGYRRARVPHWATSKAVMQEYKAAKSGAVSEAAYGAGRGVDYPDLYDAYLSDAEESEDDDDEEDDVDEAYSVDMRWPQKCFHKENFFGYAYDAGEHVLRTCSLLSSVYVCTDSAHARSPSVRWQFKENPDISQLPASTTID